MKQTKLEPSRRLLEAINSRDIQRNDDRVVVVLGNEGVGKSTYMLQLATLWRHIRDKSTDPDDVLESVVFGGRDEFNASLRESDDGRLLAVQDAAHALFRRESMHGEQIETEKNLLDIRIKNLLILLGFQDWGDVPTSLRRRRAENVLMIHARGCVRGYGRDSIDEKLHEDRWPDPDFEDRFDALDGSDLWAEFTERDREAKLDRLDESQEPAPDDVARREQIRSVLRANLLKGLSQRDAAELVGRSQKWVSDRKQELEAGQHRNLFDDDVLRRMGITQNDGEQPETAES